jgi:hypothetical protein
VYKGPDEKYLGRDICYGYNEDTLTIYDVTDPKNSSIISVTSYEGATYTHQVCVNDKASPGSPPETDNMYRVGFSTPSGKSSSSWTMSWMRSRAWALPRMGILLPSFGRSSRLRTLNRLGSTRVS